MVSRETEKLFKRMKNAATRSLFNAIGDNRIKFGLPLDSWADKNARDMHNRTPLMVACQDPERLPFVEALLDPKQQVDISATYKGMTALHFACFSNNPAAVEMLLAHGADINAVSDIGLTPLHCGVDYESIIKLLITAGADINARNSAGYTPFDCAPKELRYLLLPPSEDSQRSSSHADRVNGNRRNDASVER